MDDLAAKTAELRIEPSETGARVEVDGVVWLEPSDATVTSVVGRVSAGSHEVKVEKDGFGVYSEKPTLEAGGTLALTADLEKTKQAEPEAPPPKPLPPGGLTRADVKDFCRISIANSDKKYQKQKVVIFDLAGEEVTNGPEREVDAEGKEIAQHRIFERAQVHGHLRTVFFSTFPSTRFYTVKAQTPSPGAVRSMPQLTSADMIRAAGNDAFAAYSLACADWVLMPRVATKDATWRQVDHEVTELVNGRPVKRKYKVWQLSVVWGLEAAVFRRKGDQWQLVDTMTGSNGGLLGVAGDLTQTLEGLEQGQESMRAARQQIAEFGGAQPVAKGLPLVSDRPDPTCKVPFVSRALTVIEAVQECGKTASHPADALTYATQKTAGALNGELQSATNGSPPDQGAPAHAAANVSGAAETGIASCETAINSIVASEHELLELATPSVKQLDGLFACAGIGASFDLPPEAVAPGTGQLRTGFCKEIGSEQRSGVAGGETSMFNVATCTSRVRMDLATRDVQKSAYHLPDWKLYGPLMQRPGNDQPLYGLPLGRYEGAKRGHAYVAVNVLDDGTTVPTGAFGRLVLEGPGGPEGDTGGEKLSKFKFRKGGADYGTRMEEFAQIGITLGLSGQGAMFTSAGDLNPGIGKGGMLEGGYNASEYVPFADEIWSRIYVSVDVGDNQTTFFSLDAVPEAMFYVASGVGAFMGTGLSLAGASVKAATGVDSTGAPIQDDVLGGNLGAIVVGGLDFAFSPEWSVRAAAHYRQGITTVELKNKAETVTVDGGSLSALRANVGALYIF